MGRQMGSATRRKDESTDNQYICEALAMKVVRCLLPAFYRSIIGTTDPAVSVRMFTSRQDWGDEARVGREKRRGCDIKLSK